MKMHQEKTAHEKTAQDKTTQDQIAQDQLRNVLEHLIRVRKKQNGLYTALRKMLDGGNLTYAWEQRGSKTIKIWSTKGGSALKPLVADVGNDVQATFLELFIEGAVVFATDLNATPEIRFFESGNPK